MEDVKSGVVQGAVLGSLLFLVFINYLLDGINVNKRLFADDCILYAKVKNNKYQIKLNNYLRRVEECCVKLKIMLSTEKTVCMPMTHKFNPLLFDYTLSSSVLRRVDS